MFVLSNASFAADTNYKKSTEGDEVVRNKLFPKKSRIELAVPNFGMIMNQSYLNTFLVGTGLSYFWSETWGVNLEFMYALNQDRGERKCIESFYNNFSYQISEPECEAQQPLSDTELRSKNGNFGPAYVPIREINYLLTLNAVWNPVYGKQIMFLSATNHFDLFVTFGGGLAFSTYYPLSTKLKDGSTDSRGCPTPQGSAQPTCGYLPSDRGGQLMHGPDGRPTPENQTNFMVDVGAGQKFHFMNRMHIKAELKNYTLLGTPQGFDNFFTLVGGFGVRF